MVIQQSPRRQNKELAFWSNGAWSKPRCLAIFYKTKKQYLHKALMPLCNFYIGTLMSHLKTVKTLVPLESSKNPKYDLCNSN